MPEAANLYPSRGLRLDFRTPEVEDSRRLNSSVSRTVHAVEDHTGLRATRFPSLIATFMFRIQMSMLMIATLITGTTRKRRKGKQKKTWKPVLTRASSR